MDEKTMLEAMGKMRSASLSPIHKRLDTMQDSMDQRFDTLQSEAIKAQTLIEQSLQPKMDALYEGQLTNREQMADLKTSVDDMCPPLRF